MTETNLVHIDKRDELRAKIEASERRIAERTVTDQAKEVASAATTYVKENPLTVLGGAIAIGLVIGAMTNPGRRAARGAATGVANAVSGAASGAAKSVSGAAKKRGTAYGSLLADALVAYGIKLIDSALDTARNGQDKIEDISDSATARAREVRREADYFAGTAADKGRAVTQRTRRRAERAVRDIKDRVAN
ncbi:hypothetical protein [Erythrobacter crassostreae]|uniref:DUF883 domain-containing protein n=1 Tax=Erythrobacter crassostreae TaxID=2828328 RepID=A0A9X1F444_9SPHN|nr:hypothetical protein [Erythrobacter crassostrea]MBV7259921.1 hypothetical protein [Erythrobacter crassostrea]